MKLLELVLLLLRVFYTTQLRGDIVQLGSLSKVHERQNGKTTKVRECVIQFRIKLSIEKVRFG